MRCRGRDNAWLLARHSCKQTNKELLDKSVDVLLDKAEECVDLAKAQRKNADKQHVDAHKLELLGNALAHDAAEIRGEIDKIVDDR